MGAETPVKMSLVLLYFLFFFSLLFTDFILNFYFILSFNYEKIVFIVTHSIQLKNV
jgi:hypothetical protein